MLGNMLIARAEMCSEIGGILRHMRTSITSISLLRTVSDFSVSSEDVVVKARPLLEVFIATDLSTVKPRLPPDSAGAHLTGVQHEEPKISLDSTMVASVMTIP